MVLKGNNPEKKTLALRADFDALPIIEENEVEYCSINKGVMHACGHDAHTASLLGVVKILNSLKSEWEGSVKFVVQPAEEQFPGGAQQMIKEGVLENPKIENQTFLDIFNYLSDPVSIKKTNLIKKTKITTFFKILPKNFKKFSQFFSKKFPNFF